MIVELVADKTVYRPKEDFTFKVMTTNDAPVDDVLFYGELAFGYSASLTLLGVMLSVEKYPTRFIDDFRRDAPKLSDERKSKEQLWKL